MRRKYRCGAICGVAIERKAHTSYVASSEAKQSEPVPSYAFSAKMFGAAE